ncbi:hypothetical protein ACS2UT_27000, partial [Bacillus cereus group sp. BC311]|uniref:hypothetical protein n=1 Tax=Bacillus cereus group sp. BC311 TaxID=3445316 RepID=UPI003F20CDB6
MNLLYKPNGEEEEKENYDFKFLTETEVGYNDEETFWFPIRKVLGWKKVSECNDFAIANGHIQNR